MAFCGGTLWFRSTRTSLQESKLMIWLQRGYFIRSADEFSGEAKRRQTAPVTHSDYTFTKKKPFGLLVRRKITSSVPGPDPASPYPTSFRLLTTCCGPGLA